MDRDETISGTRWRQVARPFCFTRLYLTYRGQGDRAHDY
jgi:hypothetical protein